MQGNCEATAFGMTQRTVKRPTLRSEAECQDLAFRGGEAGVNFPRSCARLATSCRGSLFE